MLSQIALSIRGSLAWPFIVLMHLLPIFSLCQTLFCASWQVLASYIPALNVGTSQSMMNKPLVCMTSQVVSYVAGSVIFMMMIFICCATDREQS